MILAGQAGTRRASVELDVAELGPPGTPGDDDLLLNVTVAVGGYQAADQVWILSGAGEQWAPSRRTSRRGLGAWPEGRAPASWGRHSPWRREWDSNRLPTDGP